MEAAIERAGIGAHATLLGRLPDEELHRLLATATLFVHPTRYEGSPLVMLEAMAHRLPIVASAVGGIPDKVIPGETGWLVPPDDPAALGRGNPLRRSSATCYTARGGGAGACARRSPTSVWHMSSIELIALLGTIPPLLSTAA